MAVAACLSHIECNSSSSSSFLSDYELGYDSSPAPYVTATDEEFGAVGCHAVGFGSSSSGLRASANRRPDSLVSRRLRGGSEVMMMMAFTLTMNARPGGDLELDSTGGVDSWFLDKSGSRLNILMSAVESKLILA
ncbi:hypothetical protein WN943_005988 [Citrus x changshan-huyou]